MSGTGDGAGSLVGAALALAGVALAAAAPRPWLLVVLIPVQALLAAGWLAVTRVPARPAGVGIALGAALLADVVLAAERRPGPGALAGVVGLGVVAAVVGQILRRERTRVTDVIAAQSSAVLLTTAVAAPLALAGRHHGGRAVAVALVAVAAGLLGAAVGTRTRANLPGWAVPWRGPCAALVLGGATGVGVGAVWLGGDGAVVGAVAAAAVAVADLMGGAVAGTHRVGRPLRAALPFALMAPAAYAVGAAMLR